MLSNLVADPGQRLQNVFRNGAACALAGALLLGVSGQSAQAAPQIRFSMVPSPGAAKCLRHAYGHVTLSTGGIAGVNDHLHIEVGGLPPSSGFDFFTIQVPNPPFGLAWYQGDIQTNAYGLGSADFIGVFDVETFIVAPGTAPAPVVFKSPPFPDADANPKTGPVHTYHLGLWFGSPAYAAKAGCPTVETPFNGTHNAGIQALNTGNFPELAGPLRYFVP